MGQRKPLSLGHYQFDTTKAYEERCRQILNSQTWGLPLEGEDFVFALYVLNQNPSAKPATLRARHPGVARRTERLRRVRRAKLAP